VADEDLFEMLATGKCGELEALGWNQYLLERSTVSPVLE
jgi:hypothetical protein